MKSRLGIGVGAPETPTEDVKTFEKELILAMKRVCESHDAEYFDASFFDVDSVSMCELLKKMTPSE